MEHWKSVFITVSLCFCFVFLVVELHHQCVKTAELVFFCLFFLYETCQYRNHSRDYFFRHVSRTFPLLCSALLLSASQQFGRSETTT